MVRCLKICSCSPCEHPCKDDMTCLKQRNPRTGGGLGFHNVTHISQGGLQLLRMDLIHTRLIRGGRSRRLRRCLPLIQRQTQQQRGSKASTLQPTQLCRLKSRGAESVWRFSDDEITLKMCPNILRAALANGKLISMNSLWGEGHGPVCMFACPA